MDWIIMTIFFLCSVNYFHRNSFTIPFNWKYLASVRRLSHSYQMKVIKYYIFNINLLWSLLRSQCALAARLSYKYTVNMEIGRVLVQIHSEKSYFIYEEALPIFDCTSRYFPKFFIFFWQCNSFSRAVKLTASLI